MSFRVVLAGPHRDGALPVVRRRKQEHVQVVFRIDCESFANGRLEVRVPGVEVGTHRVAPSADLVPGVRRHVVDVARTRDGVAEELGAGLGTPRHNRRLRRMHVEVARPRVMDVLGQHLLEDLVQPLHVGVLNVARPAARLQQEERIGVERHQIEVLGVPRRKDLHGVGVRAILFHARVRLELLDVADRHGVDERALLRVGVALQGQRLLNRGIRVGRLLGRHRRVQVGAPCPRFAPVADRAVRIALPRFSKRAHRLRLREGIHHLEALVEECLGLFVARGDRPREGAEPGLEQLDRLHVPLLERGRGRCLRTSARCPGQA